MSIISNFDEILNYLSTYVSECKKTEFKLQELKLNPKFNCRDSETNNNTSENAIYFQLVSKLFLLHDMVGMSNKLISKCMIKKMKYEDCSLFLQYFKEKDFKLITNVICNLSDTKYVIAISNLSYEILDNLILSETITKALWYKYGSPMIIITKNVYQVQNNLNKDHSIKLRSNKYSEDDSKNFESQLLKLISAVTNVNKDLASLHTYSFWIFKINNLMFGVLIPRFDTTKDCLINVWPIVPAASFFNMKKSINNLKIPEKDKKIFISIAASIKLSTKLNSFNLKNEIPHGITLPMMLQHRISLKNLYMTFFYESLREKEHYYYPLAMGDSTVFLKCKHCSITFNNVFQFVRHWWLVKQIRIFKCHLCDDKSLNLSKLAAHYKIRHYNYIQNQRDNAFEIPQFNTNSTNDLRVIGNDEIEQNVPKIRKCPLCHTNKEGLHYMRLHMKVCHLSEIMKLSVEKMRQHLPLYENNVLDFWKPNIPILALENKIKNFSRDQFLKLFNYYIMCPFCKDSFIKYNDSLTFLTHIARDHTSRKRDKCSIPQITNSKSDGKSLKTKEMSTTSNATIEQTNKLNSSIRDTTYVHNLSSKNASMLQYDTSCISSNLTLNDFVDNLTLNDKIMLQEILSKNLASDVTQENNESLDNLSKNLSLDVTQENNESLDNLSKNLTLDVTQENNESVDILSKDFSADVTQKNNESLDTTVCQIANENNNHVDCSICETSF